MIKVLLFLILIICVLVGVAFLTLLERKILGYVQIRKGPNKVGYAGILQPFSDAIKLFTSENTFPLSSNFIPYYVCPIFGMAVALIVWMVFPFGMGLVDFSLGLLFFICIVGCSVYPVMGSGWFSNSKFALLGCIRSIAQTISYEVSMAIIVLSIMVCVGGYNFFYVGLYQEMIWFGIFLFPIMYLWLLIMLAETNRTPFDFAEGESELVSGFNVEYSGGGFAMIFMAEYASILFMSFVFSMFFMGGNIILLSLEISLLASMFIFVRGLLPRLRYDLLMYLAWSGMLPFSLVFLGFLSILIWLL